MSQKEVIYFQADQSGNETQTIAQKHVSKLQPGDILSIMVSSLSPEASAMFNPYLQANATTQQQTTQSTAPSPANGYLINEEGFISLPLVGKVKLAGLSTSEATDLVTKHLDKYLQQPTVNIRILNFKISVLGEVTRPALYTIPNEKITLPEAIALAGDLTIYGKRNNVQVIREVDGKRVFSQVDLTERDLFNSPYYYLQANDVVYVEPTKSKVMSSDRTVQLIPVVLSGLSLLTVIVTSLTR
ncbi:polysaccharide biosynthesis/export family protein [Pontibacter locisalis]|uniref:Polysaccharide biosynthesis/export family protein n=1 Tax=Pontibacter locisalis TaxID=1719035 RepID=A0ABW5IN08_9BACT